MQTLTSMGLSDASASEMVQPIVIDQFPIGNPWMNYGIYLCPSFSICTLALMIMLMTVMQVTSEIKKLYFAPMAVDLQGKYISGRDDQTSAGDGNLLQHGPFHTVASLRLLSFSVPRLSLGNDTVDTASGNRLPVVRALRLLRGAKSANGLYHLCTVRRAHLLVHGISFPVQSMYGWIGIFSWLSPFRYWLLTYFTIALNGAPVYFARLYMAGLLLFPIVPALLLPRLRKACLNPIYVP